MAKIEVLSVRKLADKSNGERVKRFDPITGNAYLANPETWSAEDPSTWVADPWPFAGLEIEGKLPKHTRVSTAFVTRGQSEGWLSMENFQMAHFPGGPPDDPWRLTHSMPNADKVTLYLADGTAITYKVTKQPGKYDDSSEPSGKRVDWFFDLELEA